MSTEFSDINKLFFDKIQKDADFFMYNDVLVADALVIAENRAEGYLIESVSKLVLSCTPDIDFTDFTLAVSTTTGTPPVTTTTPAHFNITLTFVEKDLLANLMFEMYLEKDMAILRALSVNLSPKDMNVFSPANERKTFIEMLKVVENKNVKLIKQYASRDRLTNALKQIDYASYNEV